MRDSVTYAESPDLESHAQPATGDKISSMTKTVEEYLADFRGVLRDEHYALGERLLSIGTTVYFPDMYIIAGMKRSLSFLRGFADLVTSRNYMSAAPLVRLQLDNALRAAAIAMAPNPHDFAQRVLRGEHIRRLRDRDGEKLTDAHLCKKLSVQWPWVQRIYDQGSPYVHFSGMHMLVTFKEPDGAACDTFSISEDNELVPDDAYRDATNAFAGATFVFLQYVKAWIREKQRIQDDIARAAQRPQE